MAKRSGLLLTVGALFAAGYAAWLNELATGVSWFVTGAVAVLAVVSAVAIAVGSTRGKVGVAVGLMASMALLTGASLLGYELLPLDATPEHRYATFQLGLVAFGAVGLWRGWMVSRWLVIGLAAAGVLSSSLNLYNWSGFRLPYTWALAVNLAGALLLLALLLGPDVRQRFEAKASAVWSSADARLRAIRWTIVAVLAAAPMLLVYAWVQPVAPATAGLSIGLAVWLLVGVGLAVNRKVIGALMLVVGGGALVVNAALTVKLAYDISADAGWISLYYAAFWLPAGLVALYCGARLSRPVVRLLRSAR